MRPGGLCNLVSRWGNQEGRVGGTDMSPRPFAVACILALVIIPSASPPGRATDAAKGAETSVYESANQLLAKGDYPEARSTLLDYLRQFPHGKFAAEAAYKLGCA